MADLSDKESCKKYKLFGEILNFLRPAIKYNTELIKYITPEQYTVEKSEEASIKVEANAIAEDAIAKAEEARLQAEDAIAKAERARLEAEDKIIMKKCSTGWCGWSRGKRKHKLRKTKRRKHKTKKRANQKSF